MKGKSEKKGVMRGGGGGEGEWEKIKQIYRVRSVALKIGLRLRAQHVDVVVKWRVMTFL